MLTIINVIRKYKNVQSCLICHPAISAEKHLKDVKIQSYDVQGDVGFYLSIVYIIFQ
uniref:Uncharacterized protein n=1 Tax=Octopus bimaculoides TaxID=37653 RepID=A0A0L8GVB5_OCTBM